nr:MAG TPA: baseplate assembly protein [Caudoviricetes sp.]
MNTQQIEEILNSIFDYDTDENNQITFVNINTDLIQETIISLYEKITGRTLERADPIRLFILSICYIVILLLKVINYTGKQNLLRYSAGKYLDELGYLMDTERLSATAAQTTIKVTLSDTFTKDTVIPKGIRVSPDGNIYFSTDEVLIIGAGKKEGTVSATCTELGTIGNGFLPGQIKLIIDPNPYVQAMENTTLSEGGSEIEEDDVYRERIHNSPEKFSVAGPDGAYEFWARSASALIEDVRVVSPVPGDVDIYAILQGGELPQQELLDEIYTICNDKKIRPLTDHVFVKTPEVIKYDINVTYFVHIDDQYKLTEISAAVESAVNNFALWTKSKIGRDINITELHSRILAAGVKRVDIKIPQYTQILEGDNTKKIVDPVQLAVAENITITYGGIEYD